MPIRGGGQEERGEREGHSAYLCHLWRVFFIRRRMQPFSVRISSPTCHEDTRPAPNERAHDEGSRMNSGRPLCVEPKSTSLYKIHMPGPHLRQILKALPCRPQELPRFRGAVCGLFKDSTQPDTVAREVAFYLQALQKQRAGATVRRAPPLVAFEDGHRLVAQLDQRAPLLVPA